MKHKLSKIRAFELKVTEGYYKSSRGAILALNRVIKGKTQKAKAMKFVAEYFKGGLNKPEPPVVKPEKKVVPSGVSFITAFARLCRDTNQAREIKQFLTLAHEAHYDIPLLIQTFTNIFDDTAKNGLMPIVNQPGLFRDLHTGDVVNIRDFRGRDKYDTVLIPAGPGGVDDGTDFLFFQSKTPHR